MKALSLAQPYASLVAVGLKTLETRKTRVHYRGPLVICSTRNFDVDAWNAIYFDERRGRDDLADFHGSYGIPFREAMPLGVSLALVDVVGCRPLVPEDWPRSFFYAPGRWAWELANVRRLKPQPVRGMNGLWPIAAELVELAGGAGR